MAQQTMYPAKPNSPKTELSAAITAAATTIPLVDATKLPAAPNLATIGVDETAETILYTGISGNSLTGVTRGFNGTTAKSWSQGIKVARYFTAYDHDAFRANIEELAARLTDANTQTSALVHGQNLVTASEAGPVAVTIKGNTVVDLLGNLGSGESLSGYTGSSGIKGIATSPARSGSSFSFSPSATTNSYIYQDLPNLILDKSKYYLLSGWMFIESIAAGVSPPEISLRDIGTFSVRYQTGASASTVGAWQYVSIRIPANNTLVGTGLRLLIGCGAQGQQVAYVDEVSLNEITAEEYLKMGTGDTNYTGEKLAARVPFVSDGVKHVTNPVITKIGKNIINPYPGSIHAAAEVIGPYEVRLNATAAIQTIQFNFDVLPNTVYTAFIPNNMRYAVALPGGSAGPLAYGAGLRQFNSGANTKLALYFSSEGNTSGTFVWKDFIVAIGTFTELPFEPRNDDYLYASTSIVGYGGINDVLTARGTEATVLRKWREVTVDGSSTFLFSTDYTGSKSVQINNFDSAALHQGQCVGVDHRGIPIGTMYPSGTAGRAWVVNVSSVNTLFILIDDTLTGWGESYSPLAAEMKAYFYGYKMNNGTFGTPYNGTGTKTWTTWDATGSAGAVTTVPTTMVEGYTPYKLSYQLATPVTEVVQVEGSLANHAGANLYEVSEGVIVREKVIAPKLDTGRYYIITGGAPAYWGESRTKRPASRMLKVYKNGIHDVGWAEALSTPINTSIIASAYDTTAEYTVTYMALDKYLLTAPVVEGALEYKNNLAGVTSELVKQMADNNTRDTVQDNRLLLDEAYIRNFNLDLSAATPNPTASAIMKRDPSGRAQVATPSASGDIANKGYVDSSVTAATPDGSLTVKGKVQLSSAVNSTSEALAATPKAVKDAYDRGSAGVTAAATAQTRANASLPKDGSEPMTGRLQAPSLILSDYGTPMEIGQYIDLHQASSTNDFDGRIDIDANNNLGYAPLNGTSWRLRANNQALEWYDSVGGAWKPVGAIGTSHKSGGTIAVNTTGTIVSITGAGVLKSFYINLTGSVEDSIGLQVVVDGTAISLGGASGTDSGTYFVNANLTLQKSATLQGGIMCDIAFKSSLVIQVTDGYILYAVPYSYHYISY